MVIASCSFMFSLSVGGMHLERGRGERYVLGTDAQEAAHADYISKNLAILIEEHVGDVTDLRVVGPHHVGAFELRRQQLIGRLRSDELAGCCRRVAGVCAVDGDCAIGGDCGVDGDCA